MANGRLKTASFGPGFVGVLIVFCAFAVVAWILFRFAAPSATYEETRAKNRIAKAAAIAQEAQDKLYGSPKWIDKAKGTIQLPIDSAMTLVVNDYQSKPVGPSAVKVDDPYPSGLQAPAAAATTGTGPATTGTAAPIASGTAAAATGTSARLPSNQTQSMPESLTTSMQTAATTADVSAAELEAIDRSLIDASVRTPVMFFFTTAQTWLLAATVIGFVCSIKLHWPGFLGNWSFLTYGRLWPAYENILVYGWGLPAGIGSSIWITARLTRVVLRAPWIPIISGVFWNIGVTVGVIAVLAGNMQPYELLEFPRQSSVLLFIAYALIGVWGILMFQNRRPGHIYISLWYFVGAFFWFPWLYASANLMVGSTHIHGVVHAAVAAWYAQGLFGYFFASVGLGTIYYLIPKVIGKPIHSYNLALLGFWSFALFWGLTGMVRFTGGPFPVWYSSLSIAALILLLIPVGTVAVNILLTMRNDTHMVYHSPTIRFTMYGIVAWIVSMVIIIFGSVREMDPYTHFTQFSVGTFHLLIYAFFSMTMFGAMYYIVPRLVGCEWLSATFIRLHFWGSGYGIGFMILLLIIAGFVQGGAWNDPGSFPHATGVTDEIMPYLRGRTLAWIPLMIAHLLFFIHFIAMLLRLGQPSGEPTLFAPIQEGEPEH